MAALSKATIEDQVKNLYLNTKYHSVISVMSISIFIQTSTEIIIFKLEGVKTFFCTSSILI